MLGYSGSLGPILHNCSTERESAASGETAKGPNRPDRIGSIESEHSLEKEEMRLSDCASIVILSILPLISLAETTVIGNLAVVANPELHVATLNKTLYANIPNLWCGTQKLGEHVDVEYGEFTRLSDGKVFPGTVQQGKVYLEIGTASVRVAGKYRCEVRTLDKEIHSGNLIIYLPPVLDFPNPVRVSEVANARPPQVIGVERRGLHGERMVLECPVLANPEPMVRWEKDGEPLGELGDIEYDGNDLILNPLSEGGPLIPHQIFFDQDIKVL
ncbi:unnamed protein product [Caenorhabditis sp. 36 PRJEB53466]|nr:unnamed protein product [Caenorhabditis sp. 36 PRJEB53466]